MATDPRYENGVIYTIKTDDGLYVGSTIDLSKRKATHKFKAKNNSKTLLYQNIRANNYEYVIELHQPYPCLNRTELQIEERRICEELKANLNTYNCYLSPEENREYNRKYCNTRVMCACGIESSLSHISRHQKTKRHHDLLKKKIQSDLLGFLTCAPCENVVITETNNSHTTPYPSSDEEEI
tara:strand:+ start:1235 stop:1780 length:546 start_codon:yes stop_codon:yes gene_type:complete